MVGAGGSEETFLRSTLHGLTCVVLARDEGPRGGSAALGLFGAEQGWPKPGKQGTDESERILANLDETERTGQKRAKNGHFWQKRAK